MSELAVSQNKIGEGNSEMFFFNKTFSLIYWGVIVSFVAVKGMLRPLVLESNSPDFLQIFVLSYPNFCEAIVGSFVLINMLSYINTTYLKSGLRLKEQWVCFWAFLVTAVFVITQELKIHNLGGQNVYDPYDVLFSVIGLMVSYMLLRYVILSEG